LVDKKNLKDHENKLKQLENLANKLKKAQEDFSHRNLGRHRNALWSGNLWEQGGKTTKKTK